MPCFELLYDKVQGENRIERFFFCDLRPRWKVDLDNAVTFFPLALLIHDVALDGLEAALAVYGSEDLVFVGVSFQFDIDAFYKRRSLFWGLGHSLSGDEGEDKVPDEKGGAEKEGFKRCIGQYPCERQG